MVIGITGRIASGKSTVCKYIKGIRKDALLLNIDDTAKNIYFRTPEVLNKLEKMFGSEILDTGGNLDFKSLAQKVFSDKTELMRLNRLMFPLIRREVKNILDKSCNKTYIIMEAAILFECKLDLSCDYIILVDAPVEKRKNFLKQKNFSDYDIELRMRGQYIKVNEKKVDFIIHNNGSRKDLLKKVKEILKNI